MAKEYYLYVRGQKVKVSEDIYKVYWREKEHEKYLEQVDKKNHLLFFSSLDHDGNFVDNLADETVALLSKLDVDKHISFEPFLNYMKCEMTENEYGSLSEISDEIASKKLLWIL